MQGTTVFMQRVGRHAARNRQLVVPTYARVDDASLAVFARPGPGCSCLLCPSTQEASGPGGQYNMAVRLVSDGRETALEVAPTVGVHGVTGLEGASSPDRPSRSTTEVTCHEQRWRATCGRRAGVVHGRRSRRALPPAVVEKTKHHILDTMAAMVSGQPASGQEGCRLCPEPRRSRRGHRARHKHRYKRRRRRAG